MESSTLTIPPRVAHLINPDILADVVARIAEQEDAEAMSSYRYQRYLQLHADHIISEVTRREHGNSTSEADEVSRAAA